MHEQFITVYAGEYEAGVVGQPLRAVTGQTRGGY
jgi:hypothetical protein